MQNLRNNKQSFNMLGTLFVVLMVISSKVIQASMRSYIAK